LKLLSDDGRNKMKKFLKIISCLLLLVSIGKEIFAQTDSLRANVEALPIFSYDSDVGFGYGGKLFLFDVIKTKESFDLILFNSTKGEQWYKFVFSIPDFESRHGKKFPISLDLVVEYDKFNKYYLYTMLYDFDLTTGSMKLIEPKTETKYEKANLGIFLSKGFLKDFTGTIGLQFKSFSFYNVQDNPLIFYEYDRQRPEEKSYASLLLNCKWDARNSFINPKSGILAHFELEYNGEMSSGSEKYIRMLLSFQYYKEIFVKNLIAAFRFIRETTSSFDKSSVFSKIPIGGSSNLRGYPLDRYRFGEMILVNGELRFPIWWKFGSIAGFDFATGSVDEDFDNKNLINAVLGLRFFMDNFIVRADLGVSKETMGLYLNFGHLF
jgi:outer membrane protein assembly factor BamA